MYCKYFLSKIFFVIYFAGKIVMVSVHYEKKIVTVALSVLLFNSAEVICTFSLFLDW